MHGLGNDYVFVDLAGVDSEEPAGIPGGYAALARAISDRHRGVGSDGLILVVRSPSGLRMRIFNADGSEAEMCGNGVRCFALYVHSRGYAPGPACDVQTLAGVISTRILEVERGSDGEMRRAQVRVDMGPPREQRPLAVDAGGRRFDVQVVSMGNPHAVIFDGWAEPDFPAYGPLLEKHPAFPQGTNVEFVRVCAPDHLEVLVWERGSGPTQACGTGACASLVAAAASGRAGREARVTLPGGELRVEWGEDGRVYMTGPAEEVCRGCFLWP